MRYFVLFKVLDVSIISCDHYNNLSCRDGSGVKGQRQSWGCKSGLLTPVPLAWDPRGQDCACTSGSAIYGELRVWPPWTRGSFMALWNPQIPAWPLLSCRLKVRVTCWSSLLGCSAAIFLPIDSESIAKTQFTLSRVSSFCYCHCCSSSHTHSGSWSGLFYTADGSEAFLYEEGSPLRFPLQFLGQVLLRGLLWEPLN